MPLADDIRALRNRTLAELVAAHDYHADTITAWKTVRNTVLAGERFSNTNAVTGTTTSETDLVERITGYVDERLAEATFLTFLSIFEAFFTDFVRAWLRAYPQNLAATDPVPVDVILDAADKAEIATFVIDRAVGGLMYRKPADWFAYLDKKLKLGRPAADEIERFAEAKATRDVLIHNRGVVNEVYAAKAGHRARYAVGEQVDVPEPYHREVWDLLQKIVADLADAVAAKFP